MNNLSNGWHSFLRNVKLRRFCVLAFLILILYLCRSVMTTILLTFIFTFLVTKTVLWLKKRTKIPTTVLVVFIYALLIILVVLASIRYVPMIADQAVDASKTLMSFYQRPRSISDPQLRKLIVGVLANFNVEKTIKGSMTMILKYITSIGATGIALFMALLLSFFFTLELKQMKQFCGQFLTSTFGWFFEDVYYFAKTFVKSFGVVLEAQFFIAICNTIITSICLWFMGMPQLLLLGIMIFFLSLIPVVGVIISLIPLTLIGYAVGGIRYVVYIIIIILVVHMIEAYVLNPKFMSAKTELPVFVTFIVLILGEKLFGTWGLIVSVPIFSFFLDILGVQKFDRPKRPKPSLFGKLTRAIHLKKSDK